MRLRVPYFNFNKEKENAFHQPKKLLPRKFIKFVKDRPFNDKRYSINISKIKSIGWKPKRDLRNEIENIISWYSKNYKIFKLKISNL